MKFDTINGQTIFSKTLFIDPLKLWLEYIQYSIRWLSGEGGLQRFRSLCERAITCVGLHPEKGSAIWEVYRETESILEGEDKKEKVNSIFKRHVSIPIYGIDATYKEFKTFDQAKWKEAKAGYDAATLKVLAQNDKISAAVSFT